jgi:hypothetical protein
MFLKKLNPTLLMNNNQKDHKPVTSIVSGSCCLSESSACLCDARTRARDRAAWRASWTTLQCGRHNMSGEMSGRGTYEHLDADGNLHLIKQGYLARDITFAGRL